MDIREYLINVLGSEERANAYLRYLKKPEWPPSLDPIPPMKIIGPEKDQYEPCEYCRNVSGLTGEKGGCITCGAPMKKKKKVISVPDPNHYGRTIDIQIPDERPAPVPPGWTWR